jgi:hypothetical protein
LEENPLLQSDVEVPADIETAAYFFIEVGAGSGPPGFRHQVEFPESLVRYFGPAQRHRRPLTLRRGVTEWRGRPLSYKRTTFNVEIWRLGMPTQTAGGEAISHRVIRFTRTDEPETFEFAVVDVTSHDFQDWITKANVFGHLGATRGLNSRRYGFY